MTLKPSTVKKKSEIPYNFFEECTRILYKACTRYDKWQFAYLLHLRAYLKASDNKMKKFPNVATGLRELYLSGNPFSKKMTELKRFAKYIRENNCDHDLDTMIDLKSFRALQLASKSGTFRNIPRELQNYMEGFIAGKPKTRKRHSKIERFRFSRFRLKWIEKNF